jgi:hypothetical protein
LARIADAAGQDRGAESFNDLVIPNVMDFALDPAYLNLASLYPVQGLLLKLWFLQPELFTAFDLARLDEMRSGFVVSDMSADRPRYEGRRGVAPDVLDRIDVCRAEGRRWFREFVFVCGRRGGKGYLGAIALLYVLWHYLCLGDPQQHHGLPARQQLQALIFAGKRDQARGNQWQAIVNLLEGAPCFAPFLGPVSSDAVTIYAPNQLPMLGEGKRIDPTFKIEAKEATGLAGRGPTSFAQIYDEAAHMVNAGTSRSADEVYGAATPSLAQFGKDSMIYQASSPWTMAGKFYASYVQALEVNPATGAARHPDMLTVQLPTEATYEGWEQTR